MLLPFLFPQDGMAVAAVTSHHVCDSTVLGRVVNNIAISSHSYAVMATAKLSNYNKNPMT